MNANKINQDERRARIIKVPELMSENNSAPRNIIYNIYPATRNNTRRKTASGTLNGLTFTYTYITHISFGRAVVLRFEQLLSKQAT